MASCCGWPSDSGAAAAAAASRAPASVSTGLGGRTWCRLDRRRAGAVERREAGARDAARQERERPAREALLGREERGRRAKRCSVRRKREESRSNSIS
jgi:hypothetical protein